VTAYRTDARSTVIAHYEPHSDDWQFVCAWCGADALVDTEGCRYCTCERATVERASRPPLIRR